MDTKERLMCVWSWRPVSDNVQPWSVRDATHHHESRREGESSAARRGRERTFCSSLHTKTFVEQESNEIMLVCWGTFSSKITSPFRFMMFLQRSHYKGVWKFSSGHCVLLICDIAVVHKREVTFFQTPWRCHLVSILQVRLSSSFGAKSLRFFSFWWFHNRINDSFHQVIF